jgi:hypothetical protein
VPALPAAVTAVGGALMFGVSDVADQRSTKRVASRKALSPRILLDLVRQPLWLTAVTTTVAAFALQIVALSLGSLALVEPILACDLVFATLISWSLRRRAAGGRPDDMRTTVMIFGGVAASTAGIAGFLAVGRPSSGDGNTTLAMFLTLAAGLVAVTGGCLVVAARNRKLRPLALALACGVNYGVAAFSVKLLTYEFGGGLPKVLSNWPFYVLAVAGPAGFVLSQDAFQQGALLAPVQAIITTADPVISIALGVGWLSVRLRGGVANVSGEVLFLLLMVVGIVVTAGSSPMRARPPALVSSSSSSSPSPPGAAG